MGQTTLIGESHYLELREGPMGAWLPPALDDQHLAGGILWASGDLIGLLFFAVLFIQWVRQSMREAAREDRRLDLEERRNRSTPTA
jgi:putative copper resistance protein D